jgi:hypothetical protein
MVLPDNFIILRNESPGTRDERRRALIFKQQR